ncbi:hypothetical protein [Neisseria sp.]|uniref:hypothetical protein n=1 Tax=Neisseria sp. TaxID=192066 RepID=UPI00359F9048
MAIILGCGDIPLITDSPSLLSPFLRRRESGKLLKNLVPEHDKPEFPPARE